MKSSNRVQPQDLGSYTAMPMLSRIPLSSIDLHLLRSTLLKPEGCYHSDAKIAGVTNTWLTRLPAGLKGLPLVKGWGVGLKLLY